MEFSDVFGQQNVGLRHSRNLLFHEKCECDQNMAKLAFTHNWCVIEQKWKITKKHILCPYLSLIVKILVKYNNSFYDLWPTIITLLFLLFLLFKTVAWRNILFSFRHFFRISDMGTPTKSPPPSERYAQNVISQNLPSPTHCCPSIRALRPGQSFCPSSCRLSWRTASAENKTFFFNFIKKRWNTENTHHPLTFGVR